MTFSRPPGKERRRPTLASETKECRFCGRTFAWHDGQMKPDLYCSSTCANGHRAYKRQTPNPGKPGEGTVNVL